MRSIADTIRRVRARRSQGHDAIVAVLFLLSCSEEEVHEVKREAVVEVALPRKARIERVTQDVVQTAGCGCESSGGGRGSIIYPSCARSHCSTQHTTRYVCTLTVDGPTTTASTDIGCGPSKVELLEDPTGTRFAYRGFGAEGPWHVAAGGLAGHLVVSHEGTRTAEYPDAPNETAWVRVPPADTILSTAYATAAQDEHPSFMERSTYARHILDELRALDTAKFVVRLVDVVQHDTRFDECGNDGTAWVAAARALSPADRAVLESKIGPSVLDDEGARAMRRHAFFLLSSDALLSHFKNPREWIRGHANVPHAVEAGELLTAWSKKDPKAAANLACSLLDDDKTPGALRTASLLAIGRASSKCKAVGRRTERLLCRAHGDEEDDWPAKERVLKALGDVEGNDHRVDVCDSESPTLLALFAQGASALAEANAKVCAAEAKGEAEPTDGAPLGRDAARD